MTIYYWEGNGPTSGIFQAANDDEALQKISKQKLLCLYKESNTPDGTPFIMVWENDNGD